MRLQIPCIVLQSAGAFDIMPRYVYLRDWEGVCRL